MALVDACSQSFLPLCPKPHVSFTHGLAQAVCPVVMSSKVKQNEEGKSHSNFLHHLNKGHRLIIESLCNFRLI